MYLSFSLSLSLSLSFCWSGHAFSSLWWNVSKVKSLRDRSLKVFSKCICHCLYLCICICCCCTWSGGRVMFFHHSDQMLQRSQVSRMFLCVPKAKCDWLSEWVTVLCIELSSDCVRTLDLFFFLAPSTSTLFNLSFVYSFIVLTITFAFLPLAVFQTLLWRVLIPGLNKTFNTEEGQPCEQEKGKRELNQPTYFWWKITGCSNCSRQIMH